MHDVDESEKENAPETTHECPDTTPVTKYSKTQTPVGLINRRMKRGRMGNLEQIKILKQLTLLQNRNKKQRKIKSVTVPQEQPQQRDKIPEFIETITVENDEEVK